MPEKPEKQQEKSEEKGNNLYIHFPFCLYKCHYCDFNSYAYHIDSIPFSQYVSSLTQEMSLRKNIFEKSGRLKTLYFGGGTPSLMSVKNVENLLNAVGRYFSLGSDIEITLEANPKTLTKEKLAGLKRIGINRISIGIQSLHDFYLSSFGRIHSADDARQILNEVSNAGFKSWSADLIFGFPGQTLREWREDLQEILKWDPPHLSCYAFTPPPGSPWCQSEDVQADMYDFTVEKLNGEGFNHYEISNFSQPKSESQHNLNYWRYGEYLGIGAGAVSFFYGSPTNFVFGYRTTNIKEPERYMKYLLGVKSLSCHSEGGTTDESHERPWKIDKLLGGSFAPSDSREAQDDRRVLPIKCFGQQLVEMIPLETAMGEYIMMGLRLREGVDPKRFKKLFSISLEDRYLPIIEKYRDKGWLNQKNISLTKEGFLFSNQVMGEFLG